MNNGLISGLKPTTGRMGGLSIGPTTNATSVENAVSIVDDHNDYFGVFVQNLNKGLFASTDIVMSNSAAETDALAYLDIGVNGTANANPNSTLFAANDCYIFTGGGNIGNINIATGTVGKNINFGAGGLLTTNKVASFGAANQQFNNVLDINNPVSVSSNAGTCSASFRLNTFTNSSAANMTITLSTSSPVDGQMMLVRVYDFSAVAKTITWVNTENSLVTAPTTSGGSTTLPSTVGFQWNAATSKWRCIASA